ncbi:MAG: collagen-binding domain-containing protein, partial [Acidobacteriota bacterium]
MSFDTRTLNSNTGKRAACHAATRITVIALLLGALGPAQASVLSLGAATGYNVFAFSNFTGYNTDSEGRMAVGGNFAPANGAGFTIASHHGGDGAGIYDL